jgi:hypothetical protein
MKRGRHDVPPFVFQVMMSFESSLRAQRSNPDLRDWIASSLRSSQ